MIPTTPRESRNASNCPPITTIFLGAPSASGNSSDNRTGSQKWRSSSPIGVPSPLSVRNLLSSARSMGVLRVRLLLLVELGAAKARRQRNLFSRRNAPELCWNFRPKEGVGNAGCPCTRGRAWCVVNTRVSHHGYTGSPGIPARNGFNGFFRALPGDRAFLSPSSADRSANLTPASRRQDHTASPSAHAPFVKGAFASTASRSNVRDDRETPLKWDGTAGNMEVIWVGREGKYF